MKRAQPGKPRDNAHCRVHVRFASDEHWHCLNSPLIEILRDAFALTALLFGQISLYFSPALPPILRLYITALYKTAPIISGPALFFVID